MRIYVIGSSGMLGKELAKTLKHHVLALPGVNLPRVDITEFHQLAADVEKFNPDVIINLAAICDMEKCQNDPAAAVKIHALGSANAALIASESNIAYMYISSACVFDGQSPSYSAVSSMHPISIYGKTKCMGEQVARTVPKHMVVRTEWCFGGGPKNDTKFLGKLYKQIRSGVKTIYAVDDKIGSLSYLPDFWRAIDSILKSDIYGTFHVSCTGEATRFEVAQKFVKLIGADVEVKAVPSSYFQSGYFAPRPHREVLEGTSIPGFTPRSWQECLEEYAKEFVEEG